jgi:hypothetical protein
MSEDRKLQNPYHKDKFIYNADSDIYYCPHGETLRYLGDKYILKRKFRVYRCSRKVCRACSAFGTCTRDPQGRKILIGLYDIQLRRHRQWMATKEAKSAYERRKQLAEPVFAIIKEQMGIRRFLLRGLINVRAEANVLATAFNLQTLCHVWQSWPIAKRENLTHILQNIATEVLHITRPIRFIQRPIAV